MQISITRNNDEHQVLIDSLKNKINIPPIITLNEDIFYKNYPYISVSVDTFQQSFGKLFLSYWEQLNHNRLEQYHRANQAQNISYLSDEEFYQKHGKPPWDFVNEILEKNKLEFRIDQPKKYNTPYEPKLIHQLTNEKIKFNSLSSGERILMSFALCLYYTEDKRQTVNYPKILLFDEIDAPLHPSMTLSVLNTIQDILVKEQQIKVILTTHSPSTVALVPEDSIYVMNKQRRCLQKTKKDEALTLLTSGVPTLSINHENRRQVFVESKYDVEYYETIYNKLRLDQAFKDKLIPEISLNFISVGNHGENCDQVKEIVNKLVGFGNNSIYGIIDWDLSNDGNYHVKVLGKNKRYNIENYLFDPILKID